MALGADTAKDQDQNEPAMQDSCHHNIMEAPRSVQKDGWLLG